VIDHVSKTSNLAVARLVSRQYDSGVRPNPLWQQWGGPTTECQRSNAAAGDKLARAAAVPLSAASAAAVQSLRSSVDQIGIPSQ
jgi:hypothetical protein